MNLILKVVEGPSGTNCVGLEARFDASGGLIGRAETARLSLPDSSRTVSRFHAHVSCSGDTFYLEEMGSRNAAIINGKALKAGIKEALRPGDKVRIGHFKLAVDFDDPDFPATQVIDRASLQVEAGHDDTQVIDRRSVRIEAGQDDSSGIAVREDPGSWAAISNAELLEAFQDGAGVQLELAGGLRPDFMRTLGLMLRTLVSGMHLLGSQRMRLRDEPSGEKSNPLARRIDPIRNAAEQTRLLATLLKPGAIGTDNPQTRIQEMVDDLIARIDAMRTAIDAAVEQTEAKLAPLAVEERLEASLFLDELLPMRRKARLWDLYRRTHSSIVARHADGQADDTSDAKGGESCGPSGLRELFNQAFSRAYEAEVARLRRVRV
jgi:FHA domain-containing protein